jgi:hypothetical protein
MKAVDKPDVYLRVRLTDNIFFERSPWLIKDRNDYHQMGDGFSYKWGNRFINKNKIKKKL